MQHELSRRSASVSVTALFEPYLRRALSSFRAMSGTLRALDVRHGLHIPRRHRTHDGGKALGSLWLHWPRSHAQHGFISLQDEHRSCVTLGSITASGSDGLEKTRAMAVLCGTYTQGRRALNTRRCRIGNFERDPCAVRGLAALHSALHVLGYEAWVASAPSARDAPRPSPGMATRRAAATRKERLLSTTGEPELTRGAAGPA